MNIKHHISKLASLLMGSLMLCSCDDMIYDGEGDCSVTYRVQFRYDYNMKFADAFAHEVSTVTFYLLDQDGNIVLSKTESGDALAADGYAMEFEALPGTYDMLAWAGTADRGSFVIPSDATKGTALTATLNRKHAADGSAYIDTDIDRLFHGRLNDVELTDVYGTYTYEMPLIKDTNNVRIVLQHIAGEPIHSDQFSFTITDNNGSLDWDNTVLPDENITYNAWYTESVSADFARDNSRADVAFSGVLAELTVSRLMTDHAPRLTVTNNTTGEVVFSIPFNEYALLVKGFYNKEMPDQEYLDRQDEYDMIFFLDQDWRWLNAYIYINSWKIVLQDQDI